MKAIMKPYCFKVDDIRHRIFQSNKKDKDKRPLIANDGRRGRNQYNQINDLKYYFNNDDNIHRLHNHYFNVNFFSY